MDFRASLYPLMGHCAAAPYECDRAPKIVDDDEPDPSNPKDAGTIAHAAIAKALRGEPMDIGELPEELRGVVGSALKMWHQGSPEDGLAPLSSFFDGVDELLVEREIPRDEFGGGTLDVGGYRESDSTMVVLDWKTGRIKRDYVLQLLRYGIRSAKPGVQRFLLIVVYPRLWDWHSVVLTMDEAEALMARAEKNIPVAEALKAQGGPKNGDLSAYTEGTHCLLCAGKLGCEAKKRAIQTFAQVNLPEIPDSSEPLAPEQVGKAYLAARFFESVAENLRERAKAFVRENGPVDLGDGTSLALRPTKPRREVDTEAAMFHLPLIEDHEGEQVFTPEAMCGVFTASASAIEKVVKAAAPDRKGKAVWEEVEARLRVLGVIVDGKTTERFEPVANEKLLANND